MLRFRECLKPELAGAVATRRALVQDRDEERALGSRNSQVTKSKGAVSVGIPTGCSRTFSVPRVSYDCENDAEQYVDGDSERG